MLSKRLLLVFITLSTVSVQTVLAQKSILPWPSSKLSRKSFYMTQLQTETVNSLERYLFKTHYTKPWGLLDIRYFTIASIKPECTPTANDLVNAVPNTSNKEFSPYDEIKTKLPWHGLQFSILKYQLSEDFNLELSGLICLGAVQVKTSQQFKSFKSESETESALNSVYTTPEKKSRDLFKEYGSPMTSLLCGNVWDDIGSSKYKLKRTEEGISIVNTGQSSLNELPATKLHHAPTTTTVDSLPANTPSNSRPPTPVEHTQSGQTFTCYLKPFIGLGSTVSFQHTFLQPLPQCTVYWFPNITLLYPFYDDIFPTLSFAVGVGMRWAVNPQFTIHLSSEKTIKAYINPQDLHVIKLGFQYTVS